MKFKERRAFQGTNRLRDPILAAESQTLLIFQA